MALTKVSRGLLTTSIVDNGNATAITIDASENVGIGTSSPNALLSLSSGSGTKTTIETTRSFTVNRNFQIAVDEYAEGTFTITPSTTLGGSTYTTPIITATAAGNVGIGTNSPSAKLNLESAVGNNGADNTGMLLVESTFASNASNANASVVAKNYYGNLQFMQWQNFGARIGSRVTANGGAGDVVFTTGNDSEVMRLVGSNVGIGTSSPNSVAKLQVEDITASNTSTYISVVSGNGGNAGIIFGDSDSDLRGGVLYNNADNALRFFGKNAFSEAGRFDVNGNLLVRQTSAVVRDTNAGSDVQAFWGNQFSSSSATTTKVMIGSGSSQGYVGMSRVNTDSKYITNAYIRFDNSVFTAGSEAGFMSFYTQSGGTNAAERMRITSSGSILAGNTSAIGGRIESANLNFSNSGNDNWKKGAFVGTGDFGGALSLINSGGASDGFSFYLTGSPSVLNIQHGSNGGTMANGVQLSSTATAFAAFSDSRLKTVTSEISDAVASVNTLRAVKYTLNSDDANTPRVGLIAQEVQAVLPEAVDTINDEGHLALRYTEVIPLLVAAIKEQQATIESQAAVITDLTTRLTALENN